MNRNEILTDQFTFGGPILSGRATAQAGAPVPLGSTTFGIGTRRKRPGQKMQHRLQTMQR